MRPFAKFFGSVRVAEAASPPAIAALAIYPEYPAVIERDTAYRVTVQQSRGDAHEIPVYGHCGKSALAYRTRGGDVNRRFCEFAFDGGPVRVDSAVSQDVGCYSVFPTSPRPRQSPVPLRPDRTEVRRRAPVKMAGETPAPPDDPNLLAERPGAIRSVWQRSPSWLAKPDALETDSADGSRIYRLRQCADRRASFQKHFPHSRRATSAE